MYFVFKKFVYLLHQTIIIKQLEIMEAKKFIKKELKRREELIEDLEFRKLCANHANNLGITAEEWNNNKMFFLMFFANEFCRIENKLNKKGSI